MKVHVSRESKVQKTPRYIQMTAMFDLSPEQKSKRQWSFDLPIESRSWNIGLIVGPSGSGKSTVARHLWGELADTTHRWPRDIAVIDAFDVKTETKTIVETFMAVGFATPVSWLQPYDTLSNGEKFRCDMARTLLSSAKDVKVVDEFTSVVDRQVAKVVSHCVGKKVRVDGSQFVAVSCHSDIIDWLQPDWIAEPAIGAFEWRSLQRRPEQQLEIRKCKKDVWDRFKHYHYLSADLHNAAKCFCGVVNGVVVAFAAVVHFMHPLRKNICTINRMVVLPDWQGLGIALKMSNEIGKSLWDNDHELRYMVAHPGVISMLSKSPRWRANNIKTSRASALTSKMAKHILNFSDGRTSASFSYVAPQGSRSLSNRSLMPLSEWYDKIGVV